MDTGQTPDWQPRFLDLWPTVLIRHKLDGCEKPNTRLVALIEELDGAREQLTARYQGVDFLAIDDSAIEWLRAAIEATAKTYFRESGMDYPIRWTIQSWPNINRRGDYHPPHNHAWCYLSGTYYVKLPADGSGATSFYDPRSTVNMLAPPTRLPAAPSTRCSPTLVLFCSGIRHSTTWCIPMDPIKRASASASTSCWSGPITMPRTSSS